MLILAAPTAAENVPGRQFVQEWAAFPYLPAAHLSHVQTSHSHELSYPSRHMHALFDVLPPGEAEFTGHAVQASEVVDCASGLKVSALHASHALLPTVCLYVPAVHSVQDPPLGAV